MQHRRLLSRREPQCLMQNAADPALHFLGGPAREGQQQDALRVRPSQHQAGDTARKRQCLAGAGTGNDEQRLA